MNTPSIYSRLAQLALAKAMAPLSEEEEQELTDIINTWPGDKEWINEMIEPANIAKKIRSMHELDVDASWQQYERGFHTAPQQYEPRPKPPRRTGGWIRYLIAAVVAGVVFTGVYFFLTEKRRSSIVQREKQLADSAARANGVAVIVQADGSEIIIGKDQSGSIGNIGNKLVKMINNVLTLPDIEEPGVVIKALPGKELPIQLSDGTFGRLRGSSELNFSKGFTAGKRTLALKGETYFEVAKGSAPFTVNAGGVEVTVLGTRFTVRAYDKEPVTTSLFEGQVKLTAGTKNMVLSEDEEAVYEDNKFQIRKLPQLGTDRKDGKKTGFFVFEDMKIKSILVEVAGYYNCGIEYVGVMPDVDYSGSISRNMPIDSLLMYLKHLMNIDLEYKDNKIIAGPKRTK